MKRFGMAVAALLMCATMSFAQKPSLSREPFVVSTEKLANYLQLTPSQLDEVANIKLALNCRIRKCIKRFTVT